MLKRILRGFGIAAAGVGGCALLLVVFAAVVLVGLFIIKYAWSWAIPDLFPGAVGQGLIAREISYYTAFKLAVLMAVLGVLSHIAAHGSDKDAQ